STWSAIVSPSVLARDNEAAAVGCLEDAARGLVDIDRVAVAGEVEAGSFAAAPRVIDLREHNAAQPERQTHANAVLDVSRQVAESRRDRSGVVERKQPDRIVKRV